MYLCDHGVGELGGYMYLCDDGEGELLGYMYLCDDEDGELRGYMCLCVMFYQWRITSYEAYRLRQNCGP